MKREKDKYNFNRSRDKCKIALIKNRHKFNQLIREINEQVERFEDTTSVNISDIYFINGFFLELLDEVYLALPELKKVFNKKYFRLKT